MTNDNAKYCVSQRDFLRPYSFISNVIALNAQAIVFKHLNKQNLLSAGRVPTLSLLDGKVGTRNFA